MHGLFFQRSPGASAPGILFWRTLGPVAHMRAGDFVNLHISLAARPILASITLVSLRPTFRQSDAARPSGITIMDPEQQLDEVITAYLKAVEAGERIDQGEWLRCYPELANDLAEFFASQQSVERVAAPLRDAGAMPALPKPPADAPSLPPPVG